VNQPWFWATLLVVAALAVAVRLRAGRPLLPRRARAIPDGALLVAAVSAAALVFHCAAMFFAPWVAAVPGTGGAADAVRAMGASSRLAYWVPAVALVLAVHRVWWPALLTLTVCLLGVGITMYGAFTLTVHLGWLAALIVTGSAISAGLLGRRADRGSRAGVTQVR